MDPDLKYVLDGYTLSVEQAGRALGLGRAAAYRAVRSGEIPSIRIGGAIRVLARPLRQKLGIDRGEAA